MIDHTKSATNLENIVGRIVILTQPMPENSPVRKQAIEDTEHLLGLADWHRSEANEMDMHERAEHIMQGMAQELQDTLDAMEEAGNDPMAGATIQGLLDDHNAYWIDTLKVEEKEDVELTPENLVAAAKKHLDPDPLKGTRVTLIREPYYGHAAIISDINRDGTVTVTLDGSSIKIKNIRVGIDTCIVPAAQTPASQVA